MYSSQASGGTLPVSALKAMGMPQENAAPSTTCG